ncbi:DUF1989 domain-containing protein [Salinisphaera orenii]|uniref:DUF1989 domain-containing protein n=1 Tax=Salinisphaera orenii TaxID=856731 RepID=UPI001611BCC1|nr:DUF1989 domain-containing protein [Salinisphaera orenii]
MPAERPWSARLDKGDRLKITDLHGAQAVDFLCFSAEMPVERYNAANTIKLARTIYVGKGVTLYSELARPMMTVTADTCGSHDTLAGCCSSQINAVRYGVENTPSCRDNFISEMARWCLGPGDVVANVNFFMNVPVDGEGAIGIAPCLSGPGDYVELHCDMPVIAVLSNCPQRHNPCSGCEPTPVEVVISR